MADGTKAKKVKAFWWLLGITLTYFAIYYFLIIETKACTPETDGVTIQDHWFHGFWDRYLGCRSINELGDALAGAFAPIAFLWLAGAVFIQSKELEAQREELNETQEVMREQLEVAQQQVAETRASTDLFRKQTEILEREQIQREEKLADDALDQRLDNLHLSIQRLSGIIVYFTGEILGGSVGNSDNDLRIDHVRNQRWELIPEELWHLHPVELPRVLHTINKNFQDLADTLAGQGASEAKVTWRGLHKIEALQQYLSEVLRESSGLSQKYHLKLDGLSLAHLRTLIEDTKRKLHPY